MAIDIGYTNYGCIIVKNHQIVNAGIIQTEKTKKKLTRVADDDVYRMTQIAQSLRNVIKSRNIRGILAELPISGSQNASAMKGLAMAVGVSVGLFTELQLPIEWCTPTEVKKALTGAKNASKDDIMKAACKLHNWKITTKTVQGKKKPRIDNIYHVCGSRYGKGKFEHIADAVGVYEALKHTNTVKLLTQNP